MMPHVPMLLDWLVTNQIVPVTPAAAVRGPKHVAKIGKTPVLDVLERRKQIDSIPADTLHDLHNRVLIATQGAGLAATAARERRQVSHHAAPPPTC